MLIKIKRDWEIPESAATPEHLVFNRRKVLASMGLAGAIGVTAGLAGGAAKAAVTPQSGDAVAYPFPRNDGYNLDRPVSPESDVTTYNNFYEFGTSKNIHRAAQKLKIKPWTVAIDGLVEKPMTIDAEDILKQMPREQRLYRHRCVEAWAMALPWDGYPMAELIKFCKPLSSAKYVQMQTFQRPEEAPGQRVFWQPWPYTEGLTIAEAMNEMTFIATGAFGKALPPQMGAPLRLVTPWKYGFKSIKSIAKITFTTERPVGYWEKLQASEYGFWANVNPEVPHPRWSQASERMLGSDEQVPTRIYNGYGAQVSSLYADMKGERLFL
jgi:sulfoxide reductase catalytic subunit YedY